MIKIKRAFEEPEASDGERYLVDRLWPRGVSKAQAKLTDWLKELAPSDELRKWFDHDPKRWEEFRERYISELEKSGNLDLLDNLAQKAQTASVTLVYAAKDQEHNNAVVLKNLIEERMPAK
ncbi:MAG: DUF488 family protein [Deltaproteobacteria bacterium]|nr:DUF488 family protein [Deltaproteobacteria bacterium]